MGLGKLHVSIGRKFIEEREGLENDATISAFSDLTIDANLTRKIDRIVLASYQPGDDFHQYRFAYATWPDQ